MNNLSKRLKPNISISREIVGEIKQLEDELASIKNKLRLAKYELANLKNG